MAQGSAFFYRQAPPDRGAASFIYPPTPANIAFFSRALQAGCVVAIPTETVYGLAGVALDEKACRSIFEIKGRPLVDPLIVHLHEAELVSEIAVPPPSLNLLAEAFWPGPLTVILPKRPVVPDIVTAGRATVAVRVPRHPVTQSLLRETGRPLAAPSANPFGYVSPSSARHVADSFGARVPFILDGGPCTIGLESTILDLTEADHPAVLRCGAISAEAIAAVLRKPVPVRNVHLHLTEVALAPGTFARHYSPRTKLRLFSGSDIPERQAQEALLFLKRPASAGSRSVYWLSENGDPAEIGRSLFSLLRQLDRSGYNCIHCQLPEAKEGLLLAVRDRLLRAAAGK